MRGMSVMREVCRLSFRRRLSRSSVGGVGDDVRGASEAVVEGSGDVSMDSVREKWQRIFSEVVGGNTEEERGSVMAEFQDLMTSVKVHQVCRWKGEK